MALPIRKKIFDVSGEAQVNKDGTKRQEIISGCYPGDTISLVREPNNPYDKNAIRVDCKSETLGYINKNDASNLAPILDSGRKHKVIIHKLKGGIKGYPSYGVQVSIAWDGRDEHPYVELDEAQERFREKTNSSNGCLGVIIFFLMVGLILNFGNFTFI